MEENTSSIKLEINESIAHIAMDDGKANALSPQSIKNLMEAFDEAEKSDVVILSGNPKVFCAGFDLKIIQGSTEEASALMRSGVDLFTKVFSFPKPVVAACTGHAIAGGAILLMSSDLRIGPDSSDVAIGLNEVSIGMVIPPFLVELAKARLANERLYESLNLAKLYSPEDAKTVGFLDMTAKNVLETAQSEAKKIAENLDPVAFSKTKKRLRGEIAERLTKLNKR